MSRETVHRAAYNGDDFNLFFFCSSPEKHKIYSHKFALISARFVGIVLQKIKMITTLVKRRRLPISASSIEFVLSTDIFQIL